PPGRRLRPRARPLGRNERLDLVARQLQDRADPALADGDEDAALADPDHGEALAGPEPDPGDDVDRRAAAPEPRALDPAAQRPQRERDEHEDRGERERSTDPRAHHPAFGSPPDERIRVILTPNCSPITTISPSAKRRSPA